MTFLSGYETLDKIASGGFSTVYKVRELAPPYRCFAAKQFKNLYDHAVFEQELHSLNAVKHLSSVQRLHRAIRHTDQLIILTEYIEGESLKSLVNRDAPLSEQKALTILLELCQIVAKVHAEGMLHLDLKPS
ncbi:MAG: protein kinase domain-containing protein, partial [Pontibacterium sp.]